MTNVEETENIVKNFWKEYIEGDIIDREKQLKKIKLYQAFRDILKIKDKKIAEHMFYTMFTSYVDDCLEVTRELYENK